MKVLFSALGLFVLAWSGVANAQDVSKPLRGKDDRVVLDTGDAPYSAIGRLNFASGRQFCTGVLIAPDKVLTAAHCLIDSRTNKPYRANQVHFVGGQRRAAYLDHAPAKCLLPKARDPENGHPSFDQHSDDVAVVVLRRALRIAPAPTAQPGLRAPGDLSHTAFSRKRPYLLSNHAGCRVLRRSRGVWLTDCDTSQGSSGGPLFTHRDGDLEVIAVMSGTVTTDDETFSLVVPVGSWHDLANDAECKRR